MRKIMIGLVLLLILCIPLMGYPEEGPPLPTSVKLTLQEAILLALANNVDIKVERLQPEIAETDLQLEESVFDPAVTAEASQGASRSQSQISPFLTGATEPFESTFDVLGGLQKKYSTGALAQLQLQTERFSSNSAIQRFDPLWGSGMALSVIQPLLKDAGRNFNLGGIRIARNNKEISDAQFRQRAIDIVTAVKETYWELVRAIELLDVSRQSVQLARDLLEINRAKVEAGQLAPIDIVEAEAGVASREEAVILAEDSIGDLEERLKDLISPGRGPSWSVPTITPTDQPVDTEFSFSIPESVRTALENRPDYVQAKKDLENRLIGIDLAKNQVHPRVDLVASAGLTGLGDAYDDSFEELDGDYYDLRIGLRFEYPLGNRAAKSQLLRRKLERQQIEYRLTDLETKIGLQVREAVRQVETNFRRIATTRVARRLAEKKLEAEQAKFEVGISTTKDVLDFQVDLALARSRETAALTDYNKSLNALYQSLGTTLEESGVTASLMESE